MSKIQLLSDLNRNVLKLPLETLEILFYCPAFLTFREFRALVGEIKYAYHLCLALSEKDVPHGLRTRSQTMEASENLHIGMTVVAVAVDPI